MWRAVAKIGIPLTTFFTGGMTALQITGWRDLRIGPLALPASKTVSPRGRGIIS